MAEVQAGAGGGGGASSGGRGRRRSDEKDEWAGEELKIKGKLAGNEERVGLICKVKMRLINPSGLAADAEEQQLMHDGEERKNGGIQRKFRCRVLLKIIH